MKVQRGVAQLGLERPLSKRQRPCAEVLVAHACLGAIMYCVYIIRSEQNGELYVGHTDNLQLRLRQHNDGSNQATKRYKDWRLIYQEEYATRSLAMKREIYLKSGDGRRVLKLKAIL